MMQAVIDWLNERRIAWAKFRMLRHHEKRQLAADQFKRLLLARSPRQIERMERERGLL